MDRDSDISPSVQVGETFRFGDGFIATKAGCIRFEQRGRKFKLTVDQVLSVAKAGSRREIIRWGELDHDFVCWKTYEWLDGWSTCDLRTVVR